MNTGQRLASLSGLPSGSALAHLAAISTGTGTGETVFADRMAVTVSQATYTVVSRAKRPAQALPEAVKPGAKKQQGKYAFVFVKQSSVAVLTTADEAYINTTYGSFIIKHNISIKESYHGRKNSSI